jgi:hypothetical protein
MAMVSWMVFDQTATMNEWIPLYGDGSYEQLCGDMVEHDEQLEEIERRYLDVDDELNQMSNGMYHWASELEGRVETLEQMVGELRSALQRSLVELMRLRVVVNTNNVRLAAVLHGRENLVVVEDSPEPGPLRLPQLSEGHPHQLVPIEDLVESRLLRLLSVFDEDMEVIETVVTSWEGSVEL